MNLSVFLYNRIIVMNLCLLIIGLSLAIYTKRILFLFLVFYVFIINEILYLLFNFDLYFSGDRTELLYSTNSIYEILSPEVQNMSSNLTEGIFPNGTCVPPEQAEKNRFDEFIRLLEIKEGDKVLDAGCGHGGLVMYLRSKGYEAYGITITKTQYDENIAQHGPYFYYGDYTLFQPQLVNKFDHIILPGSLEHPFGGNPRFISAYENKFKGMKDMFTFMKKYFRHDSKQKKLLSTCIHMNMKFINHMPSITIERVMGGLYPCIDKLSVADALKSAEYNVLSNEDYTWHYYFATVCDPDHFGNPAPFPWYFYLLTVWIYPITIYMHYCFEYGLWMWMWDNKYHYPDKHQFSYIKNINERPCTLFYTVAQCK